MSSGGAKHPNPSGDIRIIFFVWACENFGADSQKLSLGSLEKKKKTLAFVLM